MDKKPLYALANLIRSAVTANENTAERVGRLFVEIIDNLGDWEALSKVIDQYWEESQGEFLSKTKPDIAHGLIVFLQGLQSGDFVKGLSGASIDAQGNAEFAELVTRLKATLAKLQVNGDSEFRGNLSSEEFVSGFLGGKGWAITKQIILNALGVPETKYSAEFDNLTVRGILRVFELVVSQLLGENDNRVFTGMMEVDHYDPETGTVWLDTCGGKYYNPFRPDDYIMVQQFNGMPSEENSHYVTKHYELIVTEVGCGGLSEGENRLDWVRFRNFTSTMEGLTPEDLITKGDTFARVDNASDPDRKGIVTVTSVGPRTPYIDIIHGLKTDPDNALKGRLGNLEGIRHHLFGWLQGFGELLMNLYAVGDFRLSRTGESLNAKVEMTRAQYSTAYQQLTHELTDEDNFLSNGAFRAFSSVPSLIPDWNAQLPSSGTIVTVDGYPLMMNIDTVRTLSSIAKAEDFDGRTMLHLQNATVTQKNSVIRKPGTHKVYSSASEDPDTSTTESFTEERDRIYVSMRFLAKTDGTLTIGMPGTKPDTGLPSLPASEQITSSMEWQLLQWSGTWDGTGDFSIAYTGEMWIALVSITDRPLEDFRKEMSTQILQTASNIKLLGKKIDKTNDRVAELGITLDNELERIELYVNTQTSSLSEQLGLRIDGLDESLRLYAQKQADDHEASMGLIADLKSYTVGLYNDYLAKDGTSRNNLWLALDSAKATVTTQVNTLRTDLQEAERTLDGKITALDTKTQDTVKRLEDSLNATIESVETSVGTRIDGLEGSWSTWVEKTYKVDLNGTNATLADLRSEITATEDSILFQVKEEWYDPISSKVNEQGEAIAGNASAIASNTSAIKMLSDSIDLRVTTEQWQNFLKYPHNYSGFINTLAVTLDGNTSSISAINKTVSDHTTQLSSLTIGPDSVVTRVSSLENSVAELGEDTTWLEGLIDSLSGRVASNESDITANTNAIANLSVDVNRISGVVASLSPNGEPIDISGFITEAQFSQMFTEHVETHKIAKVATSVQYDPTTGEVTSNINLTADRIIFEGYTNINNSFSVDTDGTVKIGGFKVVGDGLTNDNMNTDAYVVIRNSDYNAHTAIGAQVLPVSLGGTRANAVFQNHYVNPYFLDWAAQENYAVLVSSKGALNNNAICIGGGYISGFALKNVIVKSSTTLDRTAGNVVLINTSAMTLTLPPMETYDDGHFIRIKYLGAAKVTVKASKCKTFLPQSSATRDTYPMIIIDKDYPVTPEEDYVLSYPGQSIDLVWVRDVSRTISGQTYYGAWLQYILPRD